MIIPELSPDIISPKKFSDAADVQRLLSQKVVTADNYSTLDLIAGVDVSNNLYDPEQMVYAAIVNLHYQTLQHVETATAATKQTLAANSGSNPD